MKERKEIKERDRVRETKILGKKKKWQQEGERGGIKDKRRKGKIERSCMKRKKLTF